MSSRTKRSLIILEASIDPWPVRLGLISMLGRCCTPLLLTLAWFLPLVPAVACTGHVERSRLSPLAGAALGLLGLVISGLALAELLG